MNKYLAGVAGAILISFSTTSSAQILVKDPAAEIRMMLDNIERQKEHFENKMLKKQEIEFEGESTKNEIDAMNNGFANVIGRLSKSDSDLFNKELLRESAPAESSCGTITLQALNSDAVCEKIQSKQASVNRHAARHATAGLNQEDQKQIFMITQQEHFDKCDELSGGEKTSDVCSNASSIMGMNSADTMSPEDAQAAERFVDYIVGISPLIKQTIPDPNNMTPTETIKYNKEQAFEAKRSLIANSMEAVTSERKSPDEAKGSPSPLQVIKKFSDERWGNEEWMRKVTNSSLTADEKNKMMEAQLKREALAIQAFQADMQVKQYEQSLRMEALLAATLGQLVNGSD